MQERDLQMLGMLLPLGIEKGKVIKPDPATRSQLKAAAAEAHAWLINGMCGHSCAIILTGIGPSRLRQLV